MARFPRCDLSDCPRVPFPPLVSPTITKHTKFPCCWNFSLLEFNFKPQAGRDRGRKPWDSPCPCQEREGKGEPGTWGLLCLAGRGLDMGGWRQSSQPGSQINAADQHGLLTSVTSSLSGRQGTLFLILHPFSCADFQLQARAVPSGWAPGTELQKLC